MMVPAAAAAAAMPRMLRRARPVGGHVVLTCKRDDSSRISLMGFPPLPDLVLPARYLREPLHLELYVTSKRHRTRHGYAHRHGVRKPKAGRTLAKPANGSDFPCR